MYSIESILIYGYIRFTLTPKTDEMCNNCVYNYVFLYIDCNKFSKGGMTLTLETQI